MKHNSRYSPWLKIANDLQALHEFVYGETGPFIHLRNNPIRPTGAEGAEWIRNKCVTGHWYWWDKGWLEGKAEEPLRSIQHVIADCNGLYEETEAGRELIARIKRIQEHIKSM